MNKKTIIIIAIIAIAVLYFMFASKEDQQQEQTASNGSWNNSSASNTTSTGSGSSSGNSTSSSSSSNNATSVVDQKGSAEEKAANINDLLNRFVATCNNHGGIWNPGGAAKHGWDTTTLNQIMTLSNSSLQAMNTYFKQYKASQCVYPDNYSSLKSRIRTSLSDAIPSGNLCEWRTGASTAFTFKERMKAIGL